MRFIQSSVFSKDWERLGLSDDDLRALENALIANPNSGPVVSGTGGLRKIRFAPEGSPRGKSGGYRVGYVHYDRFCVFVLITAYGKSEKADLSAEDKKVIQAFIRRFQDDLERGL